MSEEPGCVVTSRRFAPEEFRMWTDVQKFRTMEYTGVRAASPSRLGPRHIAFETMFELGMRIPGSNHRQG
jgi:hypothetical protein